MKMKEVRHERVELLPVGSLKVAAGEIEGRDVVVGDNRAA